MTPVYAGERLAQLEQRIGRKLTAGERHVQVEQIDELLNGAKDRLERLIRREQARLASLVAAGHTGQIRPTGAMVAILAELRRDGRAHASNELHSMGHPSGAAARAMSASEDELEARLRARLGDLTVKVQREAVELDLSTLAVDAIEKALLAVLGARSIAADLVAPAFDRGLADTFEQHPELQFQYSAVLDAGTCDPCATLDGEVYDSWDAIQDVLPDGGPNPDCAGGDRCRCRPVPVPA